MRTLGKATLVILVICVLGVMVLADGAKVPKVQKTVGVLVSGYNIRWCAEIGFQGDWDYLATVSNVFKLARDLGYPAVPILDQDLEHAYIPKKEIPKGEFNRLVDLNTVKVIIMPLSRRLSPAEVEGIRKFVANGGKIFAMAQTSFRTQNNEAWKGTTYALSDLMGIHYEQFAWRGPQHAYIKAAVDHPVFANLPKFIPVPRKWAMVNSLVNGAKVKVLGEWYNEDKVTPSNLPKLDAALIEFDGGIYVGDDLFVPSNFNDPDVQLFLMNVIEYLYNMKT